MQCAEQSVRPCSCRRWAVSGRSPPPRRPCRLPRPSRLITFQTRRTACGTLPRPTVSVNHTTLREKHKVSAVIIRFSVGRAAHSKVAEFLLLRPAPPAQGMRGLWCIQSRRGNSLYSIARQFHIALIVIRKENPLDATLRPGQQHHLLLRAERRRQTLNNPPGGNV